MSGGAYDSFLGIFGEKGSPSPSNKPGARYLASACFDSVSQEFWLFGGIGYGNESRDYCTHSIFRFLIYTTTKSMMQHS